MQAVWSELPFRWRKLGVLSLLIVAIFGVLMRYKMAFSLPQLDQKHLQHAHSHFAFAGWIAQILMGILLYRYTAAEKHPRLEASLLFHWGSSIAMLFAFLWQGYGSVAITFSTTTALIQGIWAVQLLRNQALAEDRISRTWVRAALWFNLTSNLGTASLVFALVSGLASTRLYISSIYFYLHFQYNGWFFFALLGLLIPWMKTFCSETMLKRGYFLAIWATISSLGLSFYWIKPNLWFQLVSGSGVAFLGIFFLQILKKSALFNSNRNRDGHDYLLIWMLLAVTFKLFLQTASASTLVNQWVFGIRPLVIAYLHLVLLGAFSSGILSALLPPKVSKSMNIALLVFFFGWLLNEALLLFQGLGEWMGQYWPFIPYGLLVAAVTMMFGISGVYKVLRA